MKIVIAATMAALIGTAAIVAVPVGSATAATVVVKVGGHMHGGWMWHGHRWHHRGWMCRRWHHHRNCHWRYW